MAINVLWNAAIGGGSPGLQDTIILQIRLPRVLLAALVGLGLAISGAVMQGLFRNPMADPYIIGISSGAALGAALSITLGGLWGLGGFYSTPVMAFLGAIGASLLVYNIARVGGRVPVATLLLSGIAIASFLSALTSLIMYTAGESLHQIMFWVMGGLWGRSWRHILIAAPPILAGSTVLCLFSRDLNVMLLGDEEAYHLGVGVEKLKLILLGAASLVAGVAVSVSGVIGFVGLIVPHIMRILVGPDHRILLPSSALAGGAFLIWADALSRTVIAPTELPVGIVTALTGAPFFLYLLKKRRDSL